MVVLGRLTAPYGVKGWLRLYPFGDDPQRWSEIDRWWVGRDEADFSGWSVYPLQAMRLQGRHWIVKFVGIDERNAAEGLAGGFVGAPREALPATAPQEYYWADLIGLTVVNEKQQTLGRVAELIEASAHAIVVVKEGEGERTRERLLPFVGSVVKAVDVPAGVMRVDWQQDW